MPPGVGARDGDLAVEHPVRVVRLEERRVCEGLGVLRLERRLASFGWMRPGSEIGKKLPDTDLTVTVRSDFFFWEAGVHADFSIAIRMENEY